MHRTSQNGSYRLDRVFPGVGRIAVASGATTKEEYKKRNALLTRLYDQGRLNLLQAIRAGTLTVTEVYAAARADELDSLTGDRARLAANLWDAVAAWTPTSASAAATRRRYATSFTALKRSGVLGPTATVDDLQEVDWRALETTWAAGASDWNHLRRSVSHFLTVYLGDVHHAVRRSVMRVFPRRKEHSRVPDLSPALFWSIVNATPEYVRAAYVTIAALGLRVGEYLRLTKDHLHPHTCAVKIPGTKTAESAAVLRVDERLWPWITAGVPSPIQYGWLRIYWKRALTAVGASSDLRLHDLRHAYGQWLAEAGVAENRIQTGLRHATASMTRRYTTQRDHGENARTMADLLLVRTA
jgi:integrase